MPQRRCSKCSKLGIRYTEEEVRPEWSLYQRDPELWAQIQPHADGSWCGRRMDVHAAYAVLGAMPEDHEWSVEAVREVFHAIFERFPTASEMEDPISLCYAAVPPAVAAAWERDGGAR